MPKSKSLFKALKSSLGPLVAPASPSVASSGRSTPTTGAPIKAPPATHDLVLNNLATASRITKDAAEALNKVPYIKAVTGVVAQIIKIHEEVQGNKERCDEIISMVTKYAYTIIQCLAELYTVEGMQRLETLRTELESFESYLQTILTNDLEPLKNQSYMKAYVSRDKDAEVLKRIERELTGFVGQFLMKGVTMSVSAAEATKPILSKIQQSILQKDWLQSKHARYNVAFVDESQRIVNESPSSIDRAYCTPGTRKPVLDRVTDWARDQSSHSPAVFWMVGEGGAGKSTIARTIAKQFDEDNAYPGVVTFFCSLKFTDTNQQVYIVPTIAYQLARLCPFYSSELLKDDEIVDSLRVVTKQMDTLLVQPWKSSSGSRPSSSPPLLVIIDALDEIVSKDEGSGMSGGFAFLKSLLQAMEHGHLTGIKFFVTSRPHPELAEVCRSLPSDAICRLFDIPTNEVEQDIYRYLHHSLPELRKPADLELLERIAAKADGLFIFASTAVLLADPTSGTTPKEQRRALQGVLDGLPLNDTTTSPVNSLYSQVVSDALRIRQGDALSERLDLLHTIICTEDRVSIDVLVNLVVKEGDDSEDVQAMVKDLLHKLHAVLWVSDGRVTWYHASFLDFLFSPASANITLPGRNLDASCKAHSQHELLAHRCFSIMRSQLKFNICQLPSSFLLDSEVEDLERRIEDHISPALRYACRYWAIHISKGGGDDMNHDIVQFLDNNLLFWIEVMNLAQQSSLCATLLNNAQRYAAQHFPDSSALCEDLSAASHFSTVFTGSHACKSTPHLYLSTLAYTTLRFPLLQRWGARFPRLASIQIQGIGTQLLMTLNGHRGPVHSVAFSPDDSYIVSCSWDSTVRIWNSQTGERIKKLKGHQADIFSVAISFDGCHIVSGGRDCSVRVWDVRVGEEIKRFDGHTEWVKSVAFSSDASRIVSGSDDHSVRVWDVQRGAEIKRLDGHAGSVNSVAFSSEGSRIVSGSSDYTVRIWDVETGEIIKKLDSHTDSVNSVAVSCDDTRIVTGSNDQSVLTWDVDTGEQITRFDGHTAEVNSVAFSSDGCHIVSGSVDRSVRVWDVHTRKELKRLDGHPNSVNSVAFSFDGSRIVSGGSDNSARLWDVQTGEEAKKLDGHTSSVNSVAFSPDSSCIASCSWDNTVRLWHVQTGEEIKKLDGHKDSVTSFAFSSDGSHIVSGSRDSSVRVWDVKTGEEIKRLDGHTSFVNCVAFSSDDSRIVSCSSDCSVRVWGVQTGEEIARLVGHTNSVHSVAFSPDGYHIVSCSHDKLGTGDRSVRVWDAETGEETKRLHDSGTFTIKSVAFSPDGSCIVAGSWDCTVRVWDVQTGEEIQMLCGHRSSVNSAVFSLDGCRIASSSWDDSVRVWDAQTGKEIKTLEGHAYIVNSAAFSPDGSHIVSGSNDSSIRVWDVASAEKDQKFPHKSSPSSPATGYTLDSDCVSPVRPMRQLDWTVDEDGWVVQLPTMNRIMWLPDTLTRYLYRPSNTLVISEQTVKLDLNEAEFGPAWMLCYDE